MSYTVQKNGIFPFGSYWMNVKVRCCEKGQEYREPLSAFQYYSGFHPIVSRRCAHCQHGEKLTEIK